MPNRKKLGNEDMFNSMMSAIVTSVRGNNDVSIVEFAEEIIFNADPEFKLFATQKAVLKAIYNEPLSEQEREILQRWYSEGKSTWVENRSYLNLVLECGRRGSKCCNVNTLIPTNYGLLYAGEIVDRNGLEWQQLSNLIVVHEKDKRAIASHGYNNGLVETIKLITKQGYEVEATPEHRVKVMSLEGSVIWRRMNELLFTDRPCINRSSNLWPQDQLDLTNLHYQSTATLGGGNKSSTRPFVLPNTLDENLGYLLGILVGDGTWEGKSLQITTLPDDAFFYIEIIEKALGLKSTKTVSYPSCKSRCVTIKIGNLELKKVMTTLGYVFAQEGIKEKQVPYTIRQSPKVVVASFLRGLFDTDGTISKDKAYDVSLCTASETLSKEVQLLLLNFGIISRRKKRTNKQFGTNHWIVSIYGLRSREIFAKQIGFGLPRKQSLLLKGLQGKTREGRNLNSIPYQSNYVQKIRDCLPKTLDNFVCIPGAGKSGLNGRISTEGKDYRVQFRELVGNIIKASCTENLTYSRIEKILQFVTKHSTLKFDNQIINHLKEIQELDYFYDEIISLQTSRSHTVDLSVPGPESYIAGGFTNHNTTIASIVVLFEFYNLITLPSPAKTYGILPNSPIAIFLIAQTQAQTKETIFAQLRGYTEGSLYFKGLADAGTIEILEEEIRCRSKNVTIFAKHTNSKALVGYSIKCLVLDEVSRFETSAATGENDAFLMWRNVGRGLSAFGKHGKKIAISSAWEKGDPIEVLYNDCLADFQSLGLRLTTFDLNLNMIKGVSPVIVSDYAVDPALARLEYEGIRHGKMASFIPQEDVYKACLGNSCIDAQPINIDTEVQGDIRHYVGVEILRIDRDVSKTSFVHIDPALKKDSAALGCASSIQMEDGRWGIQVDAVLKWEPHVDSIGKKRVVSFIDLEEKIFQVAKARHAISVSFDSFNSASAIQRLHSEGVKTIEMSSSREMQLIYYTLFRDRLSQGLIILPRDSLWTPDFKLELSELIMRPNKQIVHPYAGKDLADAIVLSVYNCYLYQVQSGLVLGQSQGVATAGSTTLGKLNSTTTNRSGSKLSVGSAVKRLHRSFR